jgi:radical SAM protein with 4Fe4S-binding SPASM domain
VLNSAGEIASCLPYWDKKEFVYGNINEETFQEIWNGERRRQIKQTLECRLDVGQCPPNCRPHSINGYLYELRHPSVVHLNFI